MKKLFYLLLLMPIIYLHSCGTNSTAESKSIKDCLLGYDWCQPNCSNPTMAWKFAADGNFNYSTTMFGGMSAWGNWKDIGNNQIELIYTKASTGDVLPKKILSMPDCKTLQVGSTLYTR